MFPEFLASRSTGLDAEVPCFKYLRCRTLPEVVIIRLLPQCSCGCNELGKGQQAQCVQIDLLMIMQLQPIWQANLLRKFYLYLTAFCKLISFVGDNDGSAFHCSFVVYICSFM